MRLSQIDPPPSCSIAGKLSGIALSYVPRLPRDRSRCSQHSARPARFKIRSDSDFGVLPYRLVRRIALLSCFLPFLAYGQSLERNEFTFNDGYGWQAGIPTGSPRDTAVSLGGTYSFRLRRWLALEAGVLTAIDPTGVVGSSAGFFDVHDRFTWTPFGARFILPLPHDRFELSAGGGGAYERYTGNETPVFYGLSYSGWGGYFKATAAVALDPGHHFWLGATPRWILVNGSHGARDRWFVLTGDISFRF